MTEEFICESTDYSYGCIVLADVANYATNPVTYERRTHQVC